MEVEFWKLTKKINSTKIPDVEGTTISAVYYKESTNITSPSLKLSTINMMDGYNYARIGNRYYFIESVESMANNIWIVNLNIDMLATYRTQIFNAEVFALYSSSDYNKDIVDTRLATDASLIYNSNSVELPGFPVYNQLSGYGTYGITVVGVVIGESIPAHATATVTYFLNPRQMQAVVEALITPSFIDWIKQYFANPFDAIIECFWTPFDMSKFTTLATSTVKIAGLELKDGDGNPIDASISFRNPSDLTGRTVEIDIPWIYDDFRNTSNYTTMTIYLPIVGRTTLDVNAFYGCNKLEIFYVMDWLTGMMVYEVMKVDETNARIVVATFSANGKTTIPIGQLQSSFGQMAQTILNLGVGAIFATMPNMAPAAVTSFVGAGSVALRRNEIHQNGAFTGSFLSTNVISKEIVLRIESNNTSDIPDNMESVIGRPCNKKVKISECSGYLQTSNASIMIDGFYTESVAINNYLNGGVYIE